MHRVPVQSSRVAAHVRILPRSGIREFFDIVSTRQDVISLGIGEPDFVTPWHIREAAIYALERGATGYTSNRGIYALRQAIAHYMETTFGLSYDPETEILVTVGVSEALDLALRAVVEPGMEVLYHEPCYVSYAPVIALAHGIPVPIVTDAEEGFRLRRERIEPLLTTKSRVLILNFPTNPTGAALTHEEARGIAALACERDLLVMTDEIYSALTYEAEPVSIARFPGMRDRTIVLNGLSKAWAMTGFRLGFACAPADILDAMLKIHQYTMLCAPVLSQKAAVEALREGDEDVARMRDAYRRRRDLIHTRLNAMGLPCLKPEGAFYAFPRISKTGMRSREFALRLLDEERVACVPGTAFGASGEGFVRCSFATEFEELQEALNRMEAFVHRR